MSSLPKDHEAFQNAMERLSGLEFMQKIAQGELPQPPMGQTLGFKVVEAELGKTVFEGQPSASHYNQIGSVRGGFAFTLLDSAMACAVHTKLEVGVFYYHPGNESESGQGNPSRLRNSSCDRQHDPSRQDNRDPRIQVG